MFRCRRYLLILISVHCSLLGTIKAAESVDLDEEIRRIRKELASVSTSSCHRRQQVIQKTRLYKAKFETA